MALKGIKVVEMLGLAPGPFCGMLLAEFGASVTIVDKINPQLLNVLGNGKKNIALNLKEKEGKQILRKLCRDSDVIIEPFRPGVMEKMGVGPDVLLQDNPKLIYARLTGYGQNGKMFKKAGHDINYISLSGLLSLFGRKDTNPLPPINIVADFAGGGLMCALGIVMALFERITSNKGQVVDASMVDGSAYVSSWIYRSQNTPIWGNSREENLLDGGVHFYDTYMTKDEKYMAVGAIEPQFYRELLKGLGLSLNDQFADFNEQKQNLKKIFLKRSQKEWCEIFDKYDACVTPVLTLEEAPLHPHNVSRKTFIKNYEGEMVPGPAPHLNRSPASTLADRPPPHHGQHTMEILLSLQYSNSEIKNLSERGIIYIHPKSNL